MKIKKIFVAVAAVIAIGFTGLFARDKAEAASLYTVNNEFNLPAGAGDSRRAQPLYIILHETANPRATGRNEATYMRNNWQNAYTTDIIGDGGIDYRVGQWGYVSWGAGSANPYAPVQIELQHTNDPALFKKNYNAYVELARAAAKAYGIPLTLDEGGAGTPGIKSHLWVTQNIWGDHTDPYGYLAKMGVSKQKLANDLKYGVAGDSQDPVAPTPNPNPKPNPNPTPTSPYNIAAWNKSQVADTTVNIRAAQNTKAKIIGQLKAGDRFTATRITRNGESVNGYTTWFEVNGAGWVSGALVTETKNVAPAPTFHQENATFVAGTTVNIRSNPSVNAGIVGQYYAGQSFRYDGYVKADGYIWAHYVSYSGQDRWVAVRNVNTGIAHGSFY